MTNSPIAHSKTLTALAVACVMAAFFAQPVVAQTAKKLNCTGCVKSKQVKNNGIKSKDIKNGQVKTADLANSAVTGSKIIDGAVTASKLATPTGAAATDQVSVNDVADDETVTAITVAIPGPGIVIVNASGYYRFTSDDASASCVITKGSIVESPFIRATGSNLDEDDLRESFAGTRGFVEDAAGTITYNLVCGPEAGDTFDVFSAVMTAIYAPNNIEATP